MFTAPGSFSSRGRGPRFDRSAAAADGGYRGGFTLLEISLAVAILAMMSLAIYRFVQSNITAVRISTEQVAVDDRYTGLLNLLSAELQSLPQGNGALTGEPFKFNNVPRDEMTWTCSAGLGVLTRYATGDYLVTMRLRPTKGAADRMELGLARRLTTSLEREQGAETWVPLVGDITALQIRYFDPRLNSWVDRWSDTSTLPRLVKLSISRVNRPTWEADVALGRTPL